MKVIVSVHGKFHHFDLARELLDRGLLGKLFTGYPTWKLGDEGLPADLVDTFPWMLAPYLAASRFGLRRDRRIARRWTRAATAIFDQHVANSLPECDAVIAMSGTGLVTGEMAQSRGARYVCDRGSCHISFQDRVLREEYVRWGQQFRGIDPWIIERELREYDSADAVVVPSEVARQSFIRHGVPESKVRKVPYGVRLDRFSKQGHPDKGGLDVLFVGSVTFRKGVPYLLEAFNRVRYPKKTLTIVGIVSGEMRRYLAEHPPSREVRFLGRRPQRQLPRLMSHAHVMVLPSVEEGLAMVQAQSMACGCPVIASECTGASDLFTDGVEGFIIPARSAEAIAERLRSLADAPQRRDAMGEAAVERVKRLSGWGNYGDRIVDLLQDLAANAGRTSGSRVRPFAQHEIDSRCRGLGDS